METSFKVESKKNEIGQIGFFDGHLICASRKIKCFLNNELKHELSGHTHPCISLISTNDFIISYGQDESSIPVWKINNQKTKHTQKFPKTNKMSES